MLHIGIQFDPPYLLASLIEKGRKGVSVRSLQSVLLSHPDDVKRLYIENFRGKIHTGLSAAELLIRPFEMEIRDSRYLEEAVAFQAEATSHLPKGEFLTAPWIYQKGKETKSLLLTVPRQALHTHLALCKEFSFDPDSVSVVSSALCHFLQWKAPSLTDALVVHLGSNEWTCVWVQEGILKKSYSIPGGTEALLMALWEDRKRIHLQKEISGVARQIDLLQFKPHLNTHLANRLQEMRQELSKAIHFFQRNEKQEKKPLLFTGRVDAFAHFTKFLATPLQEIAITDTPFHLDASKYAVSLGLALEQTAQAPLQLLREEFFPRKNWQRLGAYALAILGSSFLLSFLLALCLWQSFEMRKGQLLSSLRHSLDHWGVPSNTANINALLDRWVQAVETHNTEYLYIPQAPKASEVLSWISAHPLFQGVAIDTIHYQLVQCPRIGAMKEPYLAKVKLEFQVEETTHARRIHEALLKGDALVDPSKELHWEALNDSYRTTFFLKNRSPHVP